MEFTINQDFHNVRLDRFLKKTYREIPLSGIFKMIRKGNVKVNRKKKKQNYRLQEGDIVRVWEASAPTAAREIIKLSTQQQRLMEQVIIYQDENIILCNKPAGMVMHSGSRHEYGLLELIVRHTGNPQFCFVHRIDKMTSGVVMGARNRLTARKLSALIRQHDVEKEYAVLVEGSIQKDHFILRNFLKKEADRVRVHPDDKNGAKEAISEFMVLEHGPERTLLHARLHTGRTHQLRVQLARYGYPIVGDRKYGKKEGVEEQQMFLFSQRLAVPSLELDFSLTVPGIFYARLALSQKAAETTLPLNQSLDK